MRGGVAWDMSSTCVQGGLPRPLGGYQPNLIMEPRSPAPAWQLHHPVLPKQEPMDEDRTDSGIHCGSDFHSSSPGSENSQELNPAASYSPQGAYNAPPYYSTPLMSRIPTGFHPLSLGHQSATLPTNSQVPSENSSSTKNGGAASPTVEGSESEDPLRRLQITLEKTGLNSEHDDNKSDLDPEEGDEQGLRVARVNSHGKIKTFRCKQCDFVAVTKLEFWSHTKTHIKADKLLTCPKCPFVTEYKHHLEYHLRNHAGSKPFKCQKCSYTCVNKSMLNSHMKSHSNVYQYRCADCSYATKYCHSLKLHLRKYTHKPAMVLNSDGTPNPLPIIDVYGTRRGPKQRPAPKEQEPEAPSSLQNPLAHFMLNPSPQMQMPFPFLFGFPNPITNPLLFPTNLTQQAEDRPEPLPEQPQVTESPPPPEDHQEVLDLSKPEPSPPEPPKSRRKGKAFKLDHLTMNDSSDDEELATPLFGEQISPPRKSPKDKTEEAIVNNNNNNLSFCCQYCNISFGDIILYTMHMGYHGYKDPFTCNMCGEQCKDKVSFFLHIARTPHT